MLLTPLNAGVPDEMRGVREMAKEARIQSDIQNQKPKSEDDDGKQYLVRFGAEPESAEKLATDAEQAEKNPRFGHGVSTTLKTRISGTDKLHRSALVLDVAKYFKVKPTPTLSNPRHVTVILPKPVTQEVANKFNSLFKTAN